MSYSSLQERTVLLNEFPHFQSAKDTSMLLLNVYLSKVLTERFSILNKIQTKEDIRLYILTLVLVDINFTFRAKVRNQF